MNFRLLGFIAGFITLSAHADITPTDPELTLDAPVMICADDIISNGEPSMQFNPPLSALTSGDQPSESLFPTPAQNAVVMRETVTIPVVVHVFGDHWPYKNADVDYDVVKNALEKTNEDFNGLNDDFGTVDDDFISVASTLDIQFKLAQIDPNGDPTTGVVFHKEESGQGFGQLGGNNNPDVIKYAWDNYKYMNLYIVLELEERGTDNYSGIAWYPSTSMSDKNSARVVYNGRYLYGNTSKEFASVLTHEFGHWLGLKHTFEGGCKVGHSSDGSNDDGVADTPSCFQKQGCSNVVNCKGEEINGENYMDYNTTCQKMFTIEQVDRMRNALQHDARKTLWTDANLVATGLLTGEETGEDDTEVDEKNVEEEEEPAVLPPLVTVTLATSEYVNLSWSYEKIVETENENGEIETTIEVLFDTQLVTHFQLYQDGKLIATIPNNPENKVTSYRVGGLELHESYVFTVVAIKDTGEVSAPSAAVNGRTHALNADLGREILKANDNGSSNQSGSFSYWLLLMLLPILIRRKKSGI